MGSTYTITINEDDLKFTVTKDGNPLTYMETCKNVEWGMQSSLAVIKRTEAELVRQKGLKK